MSYRGNLDDVSFWDLLVAYGNLSAAVVVCITDDTSGRGARSVTNAIAQFSAQSIVNKMATAREQARAKSLAAIRRLPGNDHPVSVTREEIRPFSSLKGWRPFSTGSYALHCRYTQHYVQPIKVGVNGTRGATAARYWRNNRCAEYAKSREQVPSMVRLGAPQVVETIRLQNTVGGLTLIEPSQVLMSPSVCHLKTSNTIPSILNPMTNKAVKCIERGAHRGLRGFRGASNCVVCAALSALALKHRVLACWTELDGNRVSYSIRANFQRNQNATDDYAHYLLHRQGQFCSMQPGVPNVDISGPELASGPSKRHKRYPIVSSLPETVGGYDRQM